MKLYTTTIQTPIGPFTLVCDGDSIVAAGFCERYEDLRIADRDRVAVEPVADLGEHSRALAAYFGGDVSAIDRIPVRQRGSAFHLAAWQALRQIPPGMPISYHELAIRLERPGASRAAGTACGRNTVALIVPCHRVMRADGSLGGFGWGLARKQWLLDHEARTAQRELLLEPSTAIYG
jgi:methylated-DNA-[protein]-cysteine S-methyltransferase